MRPFFTYYGGKWRAAGGYPSPMMDAIVEPFAGSAGYALRHWKRRVTLVDKSPIIAGVWRFLIRSRSDDILRLPLLEPGQSVDDLDVCQEARWLIGFCCTKGGAHPNKTISAWGRDERYRSQFWGERHREVIAGQVEKIKHWSIVEGDYRESPEIAATWFIDPPYEIAGKHYRQQVASYEDLGGWCRSREGQVIVCEQAGAGWLPFRRHATIKSNESKTGGKKSEEAIWTQGAGQKSLFIQT